MRVVIVGGGVLGTMHAWQAAGRGHEVVQIEREAEARGASVRNFGLVWVSGRAAGKELDTALRARRLWEEIAASVPEVGFRANGSLTVLRTEAEVTVAREAAGSADAADRGFKLLTPAEARAVNPALRGGFTAALWCERDAAVEPRTAQPALRAALQSTGRYRWLPGREVRSLTGTGVTDDHGDRHEGDVVLFCTGAWLGGLVREIAGVLPVRRVRLQMAQTEPLDERLTTSVADADSFRYYPAFRSDALERDQPQGEVAAKNAMQLLVVQRLDGSLTIGDTHEYAQPFGFDVTEDPYEHLADVAGALLGRPMPRIVRRWAGVYAQATDPAAIVHRERLADNAFLVTGPGGRGMTCSPAIAEDTALEVGL
ncbi:TIGR03364 family FAD-dependent oxidoreductase [Amycolatopsis sp. FDAARGOS 1241]|uniref:TIGR03364 family FAD-dependent oxidoreductase n=1 Tax=Amycolatopsis sp. FDAARGOS 1241 TaxID=2778070 RepID=UPI00194F064A|nr:TIGR03364 family FAD-dependent oxidoreductase [Amycolatopsis sp. FDAARGOS 1241]QRP43959.1 TIGR03364 family FAD-dependent oxidoreductase [Amycolatopsis sp. FDAARGOS 1241]